MDTAVRTTTNQVVNETLFAGDSEMAALMRAFDWSATSVGPVESWSPTLRVMVRFLLANRFPLLLWWGPRYVQFYNDAYRPILGVKHPAKALGQPVSECWSEIFDVIGPLIDRPFQGGPATWMDDLFLEINRFGYAEETHFTIAYSPVPDETAPNGIGGVLATVQEITEKVIGERRLALLREVASALASAQTTEEVFAAIAGCIEANARDLPFTLLYLFDGDASTARLAFATGIPAGHSLAAPVIEVSGTPWPLQALLTDPLPVQMDHLPAMFERLPSGPWDKPPQQAIVVPIPQQGQERPAGFLVAALNPYRQFNADYMGFVNLLVGQIASSLANARAFEAEKRRAEALAELDRTKTAFFSNVSHEFRTPLTLMLGPMEDALSADGQALAGESLHTVHRNSLRLLKLVNTLLDFSRIEAGRVQAGYEPTDLAAYTAELASVFRSAVEKAGMRLLVDCPLLSEPVFIDRDMWEKVVLNLLSNAFKFTFEGEIAVTLREQNGQARLSVRDTGTGITEEQLPHIFERFHRVEGTRARTYEGTGIGLALVQELVKLHGGTVEVESAYGVGTTFTVSVPLGTAHLSPERISSPSTLASTALRAEAFVEEALRWLPEESQAVVEAPSSTTASVSEESLTEGVSRARILLADDNADMRVYVRRLLHTHYDVIAVSNGTEAWRILREEKPDLVLSDVMMPGLDGFGLLQELRRDPHTASIPMILLSARTGEEARIEGLSAGADDYITKPFNARELMASVRAHLTIARLRREAMEAIHRRELIFGTLVRASSQSVWHYQPDGVPIQQIDEGNTNWWREFTGQTEEERTAQEGWGWLDAVHEADREAARCLWLNITTTSVPLTAEFRLLRWDGAWRWMAVTGVPILDVQGNVKEWAGTIADVTERKQAEEAAIRHEAEIMRLNERLQRSMTETHHRVKNNLQLISALIDMQKGTDREMVPMSEFRRLGQSISALGVIHDILTKEAHAINEEGKVELISVKEVLARLLPMLEASIGAQHLHYTLEDTRLPGKQVTALTLITNELISNAVKHGKGNVDVHFRVVEQTALMEVLDDGPGFPERFDPLQASHTGLELIETIARWDLQGTTSYATRAEGGGKVTLSFPLPSSSETHLT